MELITNNFCSTMYVFYYKPYILLFSIWKNSSSKILFSISFLVSRCYTDTARNIHSYTYNLLLLPRVLFYNVCCSFIPLLKQPAGRTLLIYSPKITLIYHVKWVNLLNLVSKLIIRLVKFFHDLYLRNFTNVYSYSNSLRFPFAMIY